jgi:hypothetical protein
VRSLEVCTQKERDPDSNTRTLNGNKALAGGMGLAIAFSPTFHVVNSTKGKTPWPREGWY